jgi:hypothetical protein
MRVPHAKLLSPPLHQHASVPISLALANPVALGAPYLRYTRGPATGFLPVTDSKNAIP